MTHRLASITAGLAIVVSTSSPLAVVAQDGFRILRDRPYQGTASPYATPPARSGGIMGEMVNAFVRPPQSSPSTGQRQPGSSVFSLNLPETTLNPGRTTAFADLSRNEMSVMGRHDVVVMVDRSGSMEDRDCPPGLFPFFSSPGGGMLSRWQWTEQQISALGRQAAQALRNGFTLVFFADRPYVMKNMTAQGVPSAFAANRPGGGTRMAKALKYVLDDYFQRKRLAPQATKPLAIAIITDGLPDSAPSLRASIADATRKVSDAGEISITFLQVGQEAEGSHLLRDLDDYLVSEGAQSDIVDSKTFGEVQQRGLARSLIDAITERRTM